MKELEGKHEMQDYVRDKSGKKNWWEKNPTSHTFGGQFSRLVGFFFSHQAKFWWAI